MSGDFFQDPDYPDRPPHQDYWRMVAAVNKTDAYAVEDGLALAEILAKVGVDQQSLTYMARQRALRMGLDLDLDQAAIAVTLWVDAFTAGMLFERGE
jgi:hypothetical protein